MSASIKQPTSHESMQWHYCVSRCVSGAFLCGVDSYTGIDHSHRHQWVVDRLKLLNESTAIEVTAFKVLPDHLHVVLRVDKTKTSDWSLGDIVGHWHKMYRGNKLSTRFAEGEALDATELSELYWQAEEWRDELHSISRFMKLLKQPIAQRSNAEEKITGCFWEGRFKTQTLKNEQALISCMADNDLEPLEDQMTNNLLNCKEGTALKYANAEG